MEDFIHPIYKHQANDYVSELHIYHIIHIPWFFPQIPWGHDLRIAMGTALLRGCAAGAPRELKIEGPLLRPVEPVENQRGRWGADMVEDNPRECNWVVVVRKPDVMKYI